MLNDLTREQLKGISPDSIKLEELAGEELKEFLDGVHLLNGNKTLNKIIEYLITKQVFFTAMEGQNWEQDQFGRATINGLSLLKETLERYDAVYIENHKKEEAFDKQDIV